MSDYGELWEEVRRVRTSLERINSDIPTNRLSEAQEWFKTTTELSPGSKAKVSRFLAIWGRLEIEMNSSPD